MGDCDLLLTGATGFVGRHVAAAATAAGRVVAIASGDLTVDGAVDALIARRRPQAVVHLATTRRRHGADPWRALADDVAMAGALVTSLARHVPGATLLVPGSAAQYGLGLERPLREDDPLVPVSPYGAAKCVLERALTEPALCAGVRVIFTRSFNHLGPGQGLDAPVAQWAAQIAAAEHGDADGVLRTGRLDVVRDFLDVRDVAGAYLALAGTGAEGVVNVCSGVPVTMRELATRLSAQARVELALEEDPALLRSADPLVVVGDPARLRGFTDWRPRHALRESVQAVLDEWRGRTGVPPGTIPATGG